MRRLIEREAQFVIATHSPIIMAYPEAMICQVFRPQASVRVAYHDTEHYRVTRAFLLRTDQMLAELFAEEE